MAAIFGGWQFWLEKKGLINQSLTPFFFFFFFFFILLYSLLGRGFHHQEKKTFLFIKYIYIFPLYKIPLHLFDSVRDEGEQ
jgi:hypothetical protein